MSAEEMVKLIGGLKVQYGAVFKPPASRSDIEFFERSLQLVLPNDLKLLYSLSDGFDIEMFRIVPLTEALNYASELKKGQFYLAEYMIYSNTWIVDLSKGNGYEIRNDHHNSKRFDEVTAFLSAFLEGGVEGLFEQRVEV